MYLDSMDKLSPLSISQSGIENVYQFTERHRQALKNIPRSSPVHRRSGLGIDFIMNDRVFCEPTTATAGRSVDRLQGFGVDPCADRNLSAAGASSFKKCHLTSAI